ncbi:TetR/AcrR family transcriptional regulator [Microbispora sp. NPDC049125]|uniref:TetR/AcrR family transcriptional regulator n=1 Tax=Microbispora sp. NPDC049125 TaxID=3154929 RepID=UPI00346633CD
MSDSPARSLRARNQQRARDEIVEAAYLLFAERGYTEVTVPDIAERAGVGRTTFFRYFGDKQEVVFAGEEEWLETVGQWHGQWHRERTVAESPMPPSLPEALALVRETAMRICAKVTQDPARYVVRERLIDQNPELGDRAARKQRRFAETIGEILREQGASAQTVALAPQLALACYNAGREMAAGDPAKLGPSVRAAFDRLEVAQAGNSEASE